MMAAETLISKENNMFEELNFSILELSKSLNSRSYQFTAEDAERRQERLVKSGIRNPEYYLENGFDI
jgi:hypothetical protein